MHFGNLVTVVVGLLGGGLTSAFSVGRNGDSSIGSFSGSSASNDVFRFVRQNGKTFWRDANSEVSHQLQEVKAGKHRAPRAAESPGAALQNNRAPCPRGSVSQENTAPCPRVSALQENTAPCPRVSTSQENTAPSSQNAVSPENKAARSAWRRQVFASWNSLENQTIAVTREARFRKELEAFEGDNEITREELRERIDLVSTFNRRVDLTLRWKILKLVNNVVKGWYDVDGTYEQRRDKAAEIISRRNKTAKRIVEEQGKPAAIQALKDQIDIVFGYYKNNSVANDDDSSGYGSDEEAQPVNPPRKNGAAYFFSFNKHDQDTMNYYLVMSMVKVNRIKDR